VGSSATGSIWEQEAGMSDRVPGWSLAWSEEFDGDAGAPPDPRNWQLETGGGGWGNQELQYYTGGTENASLDGAGHLAIVVRQPDPVARKDRYGGYGYTSARLISKGRVALRYGLVEARIQIPDGRGIWPAFWMLGQDIDEAGWPQCGEVDIMEILGHEPAVLHATVHGPGYSGAGGVHSSHRARTSLAGGFHVYAVAWEPGRIRWYLDGEMYAWAARRDVRRKPWVFDHDFFLVINVAVGGTFPGNPDRSLAFPRTMLVDYVRHYTAPAPG
jgi:beta-glucanase (GH16 family)